MTADTIHPCDMCATAEITTPATWKSVVRIKSWLGMAGSHIAYLCDECRANGCPAESDDAGTCAQSDMVRI